MFKERIRKYSRILKKFKEMLRTFDLHRGVAAGLRAGQREHVKRIGGPRASPYCHLECFNDDGKDPSSHLGRLCGTAAGPCD